MIIITRQGISYQPCSAFKSCIANRVVDVATVVVHDIPVIAITSTAFIVAVALATPEIVVGIAIGAPFAIGMALNYACIKCQGPHQSGEQKQNG